MNFGMGYGVRFTGKGRGGYLIPKFLPAMQRSTVEAESPMIKKTGRYPSVGGPGSYPSEEQYQRMRDRVRDPPVYGDGKYFKKGYMMPPPYGGNFGSKLLGAINGINKQTNLFADPFKQLKRIPGLLQTLATSPKDFINQLISGEGMHGGFLSALTSLIGPALTLLKPLLGAAAVGAAGTAGGLGIKKLFGQGLHKKDSRHLFGMGDFVASRDRTPLHKLRAINKAYKLNDAYNRLDRMQGGKWGSVLGKIWNGLKGIVTNHGVSAAKKLISGAKANVQKIDLSDLATTNGKKLGEAIKRGAKQLQDPLKNAAKEFGKKIATDVPQMAAKKAIAAVEAKLAERDKKKQKAKPKGGKKKVVVDDVMEIVTEAPKKAKKRTRGGLTEEQIASMTSEQQKLFRNLPFADEDDTEGSGKRKRVNVKGIANLL